MFICEKLFRLSAWLGCNGIPIFPTVIDYFNRLAFSCWLPGSVKAGNNLVLGYGGLGIVIHADTQLGNNVHVDQHVTIGGNCTEYGTPVIGDDVYIGAGAKILGPITIGSNVVVGANSVVVQNVENGCVVVGAPARTIKSNIKLNTYIYHLSNPDYTTNSDIFED